MAEMNDRDWEALHENFDTAELLTAVDSLDALRGHLNDREHFQPPEIRGELLKLHGLAMRSHWRLRSARRRGGNVRPGGGFGGANRSDDGGNGTNRRYAGEADFAPPKEPGRRMKISRDGRAWI